MVFKRQIITGLIICSHISLSLSLSISPSISKDPIPLAARFFTSRFFYRFLRISHKSLQTQKRFSLISTRYDDDFDFDFHRFLHWFFESITTDTKPETGCVSIIGEVNCVKWEPTGSLLVSCSDDITAKIWSMTQEKHVHDLREHAMLRKRYTQSGGVQVDEAQTILTSSCCCASFDATVKLWDVEHGRLLRSLNGHIYLVLANMLMQSKVNPLDGQESHKKNKVIRCLNCCLTANFLSMLASCNHDM